ncbi:hypothetical protein [Streptomyces sp. NPDC003480]
MEWTVSLPSPAKTTEATPAVMVSLPAAPETKLPSPVPVSVSVSVSVSLSLPLPRKMSLKW